MRPFELTNNQRKYFGLQPVNDNWEKVSFTDKIDVYFDGDAIMKVLNYKWGYLEYDTNLSTRGRTILLPLTARGKEQKLTLPRILKFKGSGVQFSGSFEGGGMTVYDNRRNVFFIKGFENELISTYEDIENWVKDYISGAPSHYFDWLADQLAQKRVTIKATEGDIIAFKIAANEYGFARILLDTYSHIQKTRSSDLIFSYGAHTRSLKISIYAYLADSLIVDIDELIMRPNLPAIFIFDIDVYRGEMPIIGHRPLSEKDRQIPYPVTGSTYLTIPYTKKEILEMIAAGDHK